MRRQFSATQKLESEIYTYFQCLTIWRKATIALPTPAPLSFTQEVDKAPESLEFCFILFCFNSQVLCYNTQGAIIRFYA